MDFEIIYDIDMLQLWARIIWLGLLHSYKVYTNNGFLILLKVSKLIYLHLS